MGFRPEVGEKINLNKDVYRFEKHPAVIGIEMPYGQEEDKEQFINYNRKMV